MILNYFTILILKKGTDFYILDFNKYNFSTNINLRNILNDDESQYDETYIEHLNKFWK